MDDKHQIARESLQVSATDKLTRKLEATGGYVAWLSLSRKRINNDYRCDTDQLPAESASCVQPTRLAVCVRLIRYNEC